MKALLVVLMVAVTALSVLIAILLGRTMLRVNAWIRDRAFRR